MQTSTGYRDLGTSFAARSRGHNPHLSISDDAHHVTETIGYMYGDYNERDASRNSVASTAARSSVYSDRSQDEEETTRASRNPARKSLMSHVTNQNGSTNDRASHIIPHPSRSHSFEKRNGVSHSPPGPSRDSSPSETAQAHFPLNDIDYESSPAAVAQELSNLQALRRMSMDVHAAGDPDLPSINPAAMPSAPSHDAAEDDASRLFWVPARLHPELAPREFKTFLDSKAEQIKRRSGELSAFSSPTSTRSNSINSMHSFSSNEGSNLRRKKSMLSREINSSSGYQDGADRLERKRSLSIRKQPPDPNLAELENLVASKLHTQEERPESPEESGDIILPSVPGSSLKRSTRTKYSRGGAPKRSTRRGTISRGEPASGTTSPVPDVPTLPSFVTGSDTDNLANSLFSFQQPSTPVSPPIPQTQNFSRPARSPSPPPQEKSHVPLTKNTFDSILSRPESVESPVRDNERLSKAYRTQQDRQTVPAIVEPSPNDDQSARSSTISIVSNAQQRHPERTSSREGPVKPQPPPSRPPMPRTQSSATVTSTKSASKAEVPPQSSPKQSLEQPVAIPGTDSNTASLTHIPTLTVDKYSQDRKDAKKSSWSWGSLLGKEEKEEKLKGKAGRAQSHDNTRLDLLQTSIDGNSRRRETIELDRDSLKLEEERKKDSNSRKHAPAEKKEKESLFSSIFGKKSKGDKESKKGSGGLSPEPPIRELKPDIDYSWTRFSILEERAIYRMAHIKLANPRRPLYSQVLLSNFMYSYLAKVQQMHPQMNLPTSAKAQKKQRDQQKDQHMQQQQAQQPEEFTQYQRYQQQQSQPQQSEDYSQQPYEEQNGSRPSTRGSSRSDGGGAYYHQSQQPQANGQYVGDGQDEMW